MPNQEIDFEEILIAPLEQIVQKICFAVSEAQIKMDEAFLKAQENLEKEHPELAKFGYQVTWYQMPEVSAELKMSLHYEEDREERKAKFFWSPFNAKYKAHFNFEAEGASLVKFRIAPIPPPIAVTIPKEG